MAMLSMRTWSSLSANGKTILLIHGNREVAETWWKVAEGLVRQGLSELFGKVCAYSDDRLCQ